MIRGACLRNRAPIGVRPASVGGLQAPTNWIRSSLTQVLSDVLQKPFCSTNCRRKDIALWVPYLSGDGRLISSQKKTSHLPIWVGDMTTPFSVFRYSQYWSNVLISRSGVVALEKLSPTTSILGNLRKALKRVMVLPDPGGPHKISGLCSASQEERTSS